MIIRRNLALLLVVALSACGGGSGSGGPAPTPPATTAPPTNTGGPSSSSSTAGQAGPQALAMGTFSALIYNVAGLPQGISKSNPSVNMPQIAPMLNAYDLVLVQEDFFYHDDLDQEALHDFRSQTDKNFQLPRLTGDGLNRFARFQGTNFQRETWDNCFGIINSDNDCLGKKGFSYARHEIAPGVEIDIYNLHADAGGDQGDMDARRSQFTQLAAFITANSAGRAVIVAGDTNSKVKRPFDEDTLATFMTATNMEIADRVLGVFPDEIDRYFFRSGDKVDLEPLTRRVADEFIDNKGEDLSDHQAINIDFLWQLWP